MTEAEKDAWILSQAKILPDFKQENFYKSICGTKKVINGHFHNDWEYEFYDPDNAMSFISSVIRGCHDLVVLEYFLEIILYFSWHKPKEIQVIM